MTDPLRRAQLYAARRQVVIAKSSLTSLVEIVQRQKLSVEDGLRASQAQRRAQKAFQAAIDMLEAQWGVEDKR